MNSNGNMLTANEALERSQYPLSVSFKPVGVEDWRLVGKSRDKVDKLQEEHKPKERMHSVAGVMTCGRLCYFDTIQNVQQLQNSGLTVTMVTSALWEKGLEEAIDTSLNRFDTDYMMFIDGDSLFTVQDAYRLVDLLDSHPDVHAIFPVQIHRGHGRPIVASGENDYTTELTKVTYGHFGLTVFRTSVFKRLKRTPERPWFRSFPRKDGVNYGPGSIDADIWFWMRLKEDGFTVCQANEISIGHMDLFGIWPNGTGSMIQKVSEWSERHERPKGLMTLREAELKRKAGNNGNSYAG